MADVWQTEWSIPMMRKALERSDEAVRRALIVLYRQQTPEEQGEGMTIEANAKGFNMMDAHYGSELARVVLSGGKLSPRQTSAARGMLMKYLGQLVRLQNSGVRAYKTEK